MEMVKQEPLMKLEIEAINQYEEEMLVYKNIEEDIKVEDFEYGNIEDIATGGPLDNAAINAKIKIPKCEVEMLEINASANGVCNNDKEAGDTLTSTPKVLKHKCKVCGKMFISNDCLAWHSVVHSAVKVFKCEVCGKPFGNSLGLNKHMLLHRPLTVQKYMCDHCDKCFSHKSSLTTHLLVHSGVKNCNCDHCNKCFSAESIDSESEVTEDESQSPWPFLGKWVKYKKMVGDSYIFQCLSCLPKITEVKVYKGTKANLKSHFSRIHPDKIKLVEEACKAGGRSRNLSGRSTTKKRRKMSITETFGIMDQGSAVLQSTVDKTIVRFVVDNMLPLQIVDSQTFRDMVNTLNPNKEVPSRRTLLKTYEEMKESLTSKLEQVKWVSTTADCWSVNKKGYLGMTVHWLDPNTRDRKMAVLACERIMGGHTHDVLAQAMKNIHSQFGIEDKVTMTTTDNAANFLKAFVQFGSDLDDHQEEEARVPEPADAQLEELIADPPEAQGSQELEFIAFDEMERGSEDGIIQLPRQHKCAAHTLNLVASADIEERHLPAAFKKPYRSAIAKAQALWKKQGMNTVFADSLYKAINRQLTVPTKTRWNSLYDSLVVLNQVLQEKKDQLHRCMNQQRNLTVFVQTDIDIMSEYAKVMAPVANALDQIQGEKQCYLGCLIPTLIVIKKKLASLMTSSNLRFCEPLVNTLLAAMDRRFAATFEDEECLLATAFHPKFRLKWMGASEETMAKRSEVKSLMERKVEEFLRCANQETASNSSSSSSSEDMETEDYYSSICDEEDDTGGHHRLTKFKAAYIVKVWLQAKGTDSLADPAFNGEKVIIDLFLRYNTAMPSSAAVERLFSFGKDSYRAKRSSLSDDNFNMLMFMKGNMLQNLV